MAVVVGGGRDLPHLDHYHHCHCYQDRRHDRHRSRTLPCILSICFFLC